MIGFKRPRQRPASEGFTWPKGRSSTPDAIFSNFGPRLFPKHLTAPLGGYDYDFHRGSDIQIDAGDPVYSVIAGTLTRATRTHFGWERAEQLAFWDEVDPDGDATFARVAPSTLRITGSRVGAQTFPACPYFEANAAQLDPSTGRWGVRAELTSDPTVTGGVIGFGIWDSSTNEYIALEYDGVTVTVRGFGTGGAFSVDGDDAAASPKYLDLYYTSADDTLTWRYGDDPASFTTLAAEATFSDLITNKDRQCWRPVIYWRSLDTNVAAQTVDVDFFGWWDFQTIPKFGNWTQINTLTHKFYQMHMQDLVVELGQVVESGQLLGYAGITGFDETSGTNTGAHVHVEYSSINNFFYNDYDGQNMCKAGIMPRANVSNNVSAVMTEENDPDGVACHKMVVTCTRADQDFDANEFRVVGNTTSRTVNFDTSAGIHPTNWRIPKYDGIYITCSAFDEDSPTLVFTFYFSKAVVGATFVSAYVKDCSGTTLWSQ